MTTEPLFPNATVQLTGQDANDLFIIGRVRPALRKAGATPEQVETFTTEAMSGDYGHLLQTCMKWVDVQ